MDEKEFKIPQEQVVPMEHVAEEVKGLRIAFVNVFGVAHRGGSWTLIDAGLPFTAPLIRNWAEKNFHRPPNAIFLTHGHFDHVSAARELAEEWNVLIYAHPLEHPYLTGREEYPKPNVGAGGGAMTLLSPLYPRGPVDLGTRLRALPVDDIMLDDLMPGWELLHTPGHTPGHVSFLRCDDKTVIVGDAFCTTKPESFFQAAIAQEPELHAPPAYFTGDWELARMSIELLAAVGPNIVAPGHGQPLTGENVSEKLRELSRTVIEEGRKRPAA